MSSWLLLAAGAAADAAFDGGAAAALAVAALAAVTFDGGPLSVTGLGAVAKAFSGFAAAGGGGGGEGGVDAFSATGGFASSSAMMRRIDARISSIEGSWTFAGCVISDSKSSTPSHAFYHQASRDFSVPELQAGNFLALA
jgi:hypothetical protein